MAKFEKNLWEPIAPRFRILRNGEKVEKFLADHNLIGLKWRMLEDCRQGLSVESLIKLCNVLNVSPAWLLFGRGPRSLSDLERKAQKLKDNNSLRDDLLNGFQSDETRGVNAPRKKSAKKGIVSPFPPRRDENRAKKS